MSDWISTRSEAPVCIGILCRRMPESETSMTDPHVLIDGQRETERERERERETDRQTDRQTASQTDRQTDRRTEGRTGQDRTGQDRQTKLPPSAFLHSHARSASFLAVYSRAFSAKRRPNSHNHSYVHYSLNSRAYVITRVFIHYSQ